jgi:oxygen-independent coproporphyrinogen-3 oxidase
LQVTYGRELCDRVLQVLAKYEDQQWVKFAKQDQDIRIMLIPPDGWLFSNIVIADLYENLVTD